MDAEKAGLTTGPEAWKFVTTSDRHHVMRSCEDRYSSGGPQALSNRKRSLLGKRKRSIWDIAELYALAVALQRIRGGAAG
jgi:hypothetical protein